MNKPLFIFRDNRLLRAFEGNKRLSGYDLRNLPNDVFISYVNSLGKRNWFRKDLTPVYKDDISKELEAALQIELLLLT